MLSPRKEIILKSIVGQYIARARPVSSRSIMADCNLRVSPATIRNEMAKLGEEGYITRPHPSAGSIPLDKGYRCYVDSLGDVALPAVEQRLISHVFHQVEMELEEWLSLAAALIARMAQNAAVVTMPKWDSCQFKHLELVSLQDSLALVVLVLSGARLRQHLITFDQPVSQAQLTIVANKLSAAYAGLTSEQISTRDSSFPRLEQQVTDCLLRIMEAEDRREYAAPYLDGVHFTLNQPEFAHDYHMALNLMELIEQRNLLRSIVPSGLTGDKVRVVIGRENKTETFHDYSVVISRYGLPREAVGTVGVIGPTRMAYSRTIATVAYLASVLSGLVARLYGRKLSAERDVDTTS